MNTFKKYVIEMRNPRSGAVETYNTMAENIGEVERSLDVFREGGYEILSCHESVGEYHRKWTIVGLEGLCDDFGFCEPYAAGEEIRRRQAKGEDLTEQDIERIARLYGCRVKWEG